MTNRISKACKEEIYTYVKYLFDNDPVLANALADFPFGDGACLFGWLRNRAGLKRVVTNALEARAWFAGQKPAWSPPLPLDYAAIRKLQRDRISKIRMVGYFAESLRQQCWPWWRHPRFVDYACAVMASPHAPPRLHLDPECYWTYPPKPLEPADGQAYLRCGGLWPLNTAPEAAISAA